MLWPLYEITDFTFLFISLFSSPELFTDTEENKLTSYPKLFLFFFKDEPFHSISY